MSFNPANLTNQGSSTIFSADGTNYQWIYTTTDTLATIDGDTDYFDSLSSVIRKYDYILVIANGVNGMYVINGVSPGSNVTFVHLI